MSISNALSNASSGLKASARLANTISNNVANALTKGYAKRTTELSAVSLGGYGSGVRVVTTTRSESAYLTSERRIADSSVGGASTRSDAYDRLMTAMGQAGSDGSLSSNATALETALMQAVASPQSTTVLTAAVSAAKDLVQSLNKVAAEVDNVRTDADAEIARQVATVNSSLHQIDDLNTKITNMELQGTDTTALQDQRDKLVDDISKIIPVRSVKRDGDKLAVYTQNGAVLLDGKVWELKFNAAPTTVTSDQVIGTPLSTLMQDQGAATGPVTIATGTGWGLMDGGSLSALFEVRDQIAPEFDAETDRFANDLIERFRDLMPASALDASGNGLFVDSSAGGVAGLAGRIAVNAAVDPDQGGAVWQLRDGLSATTQGAVGDGSTLQAMTDAMALARDPIGFVSQSAKNGSATMASEISSYFAGKSARSDDDRSFATSRQATLAEQETNTVGVDSDNELEFLTVVQQAYAANAKVLTTIDEMMQQLLEM